MIQFEIDVQDRFSRELEQFGRRAPTIALRIARTIAQAFRAFTKKNYMRGQVIGRRTGELLKSVKIVTDKRTRDAVIVKPWAMLANIYHNPAGATIVPKTGTMLKFTNKQGEEVFVKKVYLAPRPWVPRAYAGFQWDTEVKKAADKVIDREIAKLQAKQGATGG